jgi:nitrite reductase/ring-hydroxylating ferredoxin subunit
MHPSATSLSHSTELYVVFVYEEPSLHVGRPRPCAAARLGVLMARIVLTTVFLLLETFAARRLPSIARRAPTPRMTAMLPEGAQAEEATATGSTPFDWFESWYPVNVVETMDLTRPHRVQLLGLDLVAWNDGPTVDGRKEEGAWRVFEDACPHRLGPLSEGRIEADGNLLCSYHGWRFDGCGGCADLPYAPPEKAERQRSSRRAGCTACAAQPHQT